jgi:hypothetical protein
LEELAQNGRVIKRAAHRLRYFVCCLAARIRARCALKKRRICSLAEEKSSAFGFILFT